MAGTRLPRLFRLVTLLQSRTTRRAKDLARVMGVSERTVFRDLEALSAAHIPVHFDSVEGRYRINSDYFLPPIQLTLGEAMALSVLGAEMGQSGQVPFLQEAWQAVTKIRSHLPAAVLDELEPLDGRVRVQTTQVSPQAGSASHFETLRQSIARRRKVRCVYDGGHRDGAFLFRPYSLFFAQRAWYVIGLNERRGQERSLKLNRIREVKLTDMPYMIPDDWTLQKSMGNAWRMIRGQSQYKVSIRFDAEFGRSVADTLWHPSQSISWQRDGTLLFECTVDGLDEIVWWILGYGQHATVLHPPQLRERLGVAVKAMQKAYSGK